jgi:hypothetical protein
MPYFDYRKFLLSGGLFALAGVAGLWAWNTLAGLFGLPPAQLRHALALLLLLSMLRLCAGTRSRRHYCERGGRHERSHC